MAEQFPITDKTAITRLPKRGTYDKEIVYSILDEALYCTLAFVRNGNPFQIPTGFVRIGNQLYIHGSVGSTYLRDLVAGKLPVCIGATLMDGLVLARSAFHHSVNYRSVVLFSEPRLVADRDEQTVALKAFTEKICAGRWADVRKPTENEWKATMVVAFAIEEASAKIRTGPPKDDEEDYGMDVWAGVVPMKIEKGLPIQDPALKAGVGLPSYLRK
jgi:uncharacterized protein